MTMTNKEGAVIYKQTVGSLNGLMIMAAPGSHVDVYLLDKKNS
ncbi:MAG: hypothetical protein WBA83_10070 [Burkholderiaceae bacterium]